MSSLYPEENSAQLKQWIIHHISVMSDADSDILGDYVLALLKNGGSPQEIKQLCLTDLDDFLQDNTSKFVNELFHALETREYMGLPKSSTYQPPPEYSQRIETFEVSTPNGPRVGGHPTTGLESRFQPRPDRSADLAQRFQQQQQQPPNVQPHFQHQQPLPPANFSSRGGRGGLRQTNNRQHPRQEGANLLANRSAMSLLRPPNPEAKTLVVEHIPQDKLSKESLLEHFGKFGNVIDVKIDSDLALATVEFESNPQAYQAWTSPEPVFGDRFVKVFWRSPDSQHANGLQGNNHNNNALSTASPAATSASSSPAPQIDVEEIKRRGAEKQKEYEARAAKLRANQAAHEELEKKKAELVKKQLEQRILVEKMRQKEKNATNSNDAESAASQTAILEAQLAALESQAASLGLTVAGGSSNRGGGGAFMTRGGGSSHGGGYRGNRGGANRFSPYGGGSGHHHSSTGFQPNPRYNLDLRTKSIEITGLPNESQSNEKLASYLLGIGEYESIQPSSSNNDNNNNNSKIIVFKDRRTAETFMRGGEDIPEIGKVSLKWHNQKQQQQQQVPSTPPPVTNNNNNNNNTNNHHDMEIDL